MSYDPEFKRHVESEYAIWMRNFHRSVQAQDERAIVKALERAHALATILSLWGMIDENTQWSDGAEQAQGAGAKQ